MQLLQNYEESSRWFRYYILSEILKISDDEISKKHFNFYFKKSLGADSIVEEIVIVDQYFLAKKTEIRTRGTRLLRTASKRGGPPLPFLPTPVPVIELQRHLSCMVVATC